MLPKNVPSPIENGECMIRIIDVPSDRWSPLQRLAHVFHQDLHVDGVDVRTAARRHIATLNRDQRGVLKRERELVLANYPGKSDKGITRAWGKMGAQAWAEGLTTREMLDEFLGML
jgi:hypothetical protein